MEKILDKVNQNVQDALKKFQDTKNKEYEKTQKQIKKHREDFSKHQSETKDTKKRDTLIKEDNTNYKREIEKKMWKTSEKRIKQKSWK
jgi:uncharacterized protein YicC (UPF0701 family)